MTSRSKIPILDLGPEIDSLWDSLQEAIARVLRSGHFILGPEVAAFEAEVARYLGVEHAVGVNSGTDALVLALRALNIGPGDEVITSPFTFFATAEAISNVGATPVFVDIDPETFNIDPGLIEASITPRTKAVMPVHLFGAAADLDEIMSITTARRLSLVEDAAQAFGAGYNGRKVGTFGEAAAFSFFPSKNLGAFGDAGMVTTDNEELAAAVRMLRTHGAKKKYCNEMFGYNSRLDEIQAATLRVKLPAVDAANRNRRDVARLYDELLADIPWIRVPRAKAGAYHVYHQYTVRVVQRARDEIRAGLERSGVGSMVYYPVPVHQLPVYQGTRSVHLPHAEKAASEVLSLPMGPSLSADEVGEIVDALRRV